MTLTEAIEKAEQWRKVEWREGTVTSVADCGDRWFFGFEEDDSFSALFLFVYKAGGKIEGLSYAEYVDLLSTGEITSEEIDLPKR